MFAKNVSGIRMIPGDFSTPNENRLLRPLFSEALRRPVNLEGAIGLRGLDSEASGIHDQSVKLHVYPWISLRCLRASIPKRPLKFALI
jgi:hypothetical protein